MSASLRVGVLGLGSMGRHHVRNARNTEGFELVAVADASGWPVLCRCWTPFLP